jgi:hypothetical protein
MGCIVERQARQSTGSKSHITELSRQDWFLRFCKSIALRDPTAANIPVDQSNFMLGCWVLSIMKGDNILGLNIRSSTIRNYVKAAAKLYTARRLADPFESPALEINYPAVLIKALKAYESIPNRREIICDAMLEHIERLARQAPQDSLYASFFNWLAWSRYSGPRRSEWCQTRKTKFDTVENGPPGESQAFRLDDISFYDADGREVPLHSDNWHKVKYASVRWRFQKNNENGETIKYYEDEINVRWCPCSALWNIALRAVRLGIPAHEPIAQHLTDKGDRHFITDKDVKSILQDAAKQTLGITDRNVLARWTCHSLRVTAANELHRLGFSDLYIKLRLRWKSDAFMNYLRHTVHVARNHTKALSLSKANLELQKSNLDSMNSKFKGLQVYREPSIDDILWEKNFYAAAA